MSAKGKLLRLFEKLVLEEGEVLDVVAPDPRFRVVTWRTRAEHAAKWQPGDKLQIVLPSDDVRTYTPTRWLPDGTATLVIYLQSDTPAARWARALARGDRFSSISPQRSLTMPEGPISIVGDESSLAVAASYSLARPGSVDVALEVDAGTTITETARAIGLEGARFVERPSGAPRGRALADALMPARGAVGITGGGELVQRVRARLREQGVREIKTKAYWVEGRAGID